MLFNSIPYMLFLPAVLLVYYPLPNRLKPIWLLLCSYFFYMCWNARYLVLILTSTLVTWACGLAIEKAENSGAEERVKTRKKKGAVAFGLILNLGILFFFKYFHFAMDNLAALLALARISFRQPAFDVLLPVGISFYTFQALGYMIDVYRGDIAAEHSLPRYALFVSFFPQLVAGPIERSKNLLGQLAAPQKLRFDNLLEGLYLMLWGFFLKIVLADRIAAFVDSVSGPNYMDYGRVTVILPEHGFLDYATYNGNAALHCVFQGPQEPLEPFRYVDISYCCTFQCIVVSILIPEDFCGHTIVAMRHSVGPGQQHIGDGSCQAAISVIKRMDGHEPQVGHRCFQDRIDIVHIVDPIQEQRHSLGNICRCRGFVVNLLLSECPGDNLHRFFSNSPTCHCYRMDTAAACGKQSGVPIEQTLLAQLIGVITDGIDHYLNNPLRVVIRLGKTFGGDT